jgi:glycogen operon protein
MSYHAENAWQNDFSGDRMAAGVMYFGKYASTESLEDDGFIYVGYNFHAGLQHLALPKLPEEKKWYLYMDTSLGRQPFLLTAEPKEGQLIKLQGQSVVILIGK